MAFHQFLVFACASAVFPQPFHTVNAWDFQLPQHGFKLFRKLQHLSLGQAFVFLLAPLFLLLQFPPGNLDFFQFPSRSLKNGILLKYQGVLKLQIAQNFPALGKLLPVFPADSQKLSLFFSVSSQLLL